jgi:Mannosyl-glycoprotein endo-beta-N-acetylglucosaminidase/LysM domain
MQNIRKGIIFLMLLTSFISHAQNSEIIKNYISKYKDLAIKEMKRTGVPASITLAQGIEESGAGTSELVLASNNHFGIKCKSNWKGESVKHDDDFPQECFRKYPSSEDSYKDHSDFLKANQRYASLFTLDPEDYEGWAIGLKKAGYATEQKYAEALIRLINDYHLQDYTLIALGKKPDNSESAEKVPEDSHTDAKSVVLQSKVAPATSSPKVTKKEEKEIENNQADKMNRNPLYPDGEFKINETRVVYVRKGTSFFAIANQYHIDLYKLFDYNEIPQAEETNEDQLVYLQRKHKTGNNKFHKILPGETLHDIAQLEGIRIECLMELNQLKKDMQPAIGEQLSLHSKSATMPKLAEKDNYSMAPAAKNKSTD